MGFKGVSASARRILWSRFLTHSGDQAWDFALPLALVGIITGGIGSVALFYLIVRTGHLLLVSKVCGLLDRWNRLFAVRVGIGAQTLGVVAALIAINGLLANQTDTQLFGWGATSAFFVLALMAGIVGITFAEGRDAVWIFIAFILLSRIGLYGFSLGETEIRQLSIADGSRGRINGFAQALTSLATIGVYAGGTYFADRGRFEVLIFLSIGFVVFAAALFTAWSISRAAIINVELDTKI